MQALQFSVTLFTYCGVLLHSEFSLLLHYSEFFFLCYRYKKVAYLDTDVGQPEFTPPGFVSIHVLEEQAEGVTFMFLSIFPEFSSHFCVTG